MQSSVVKVILMKGCCCSIQKGSSASMLPCFSLYRPRSIYERRNLMLLLLCQRLLLLWTRAGVGAGISKQKAVAVKHPEKYIIILSIIENEEWFHCLIYTICMVAKRGVKESSLIIFNRRIRSFSCITVKQIYCVLDWPIRLPLDCNSLINVLCPLMMTLKPHIYTI